jgi:hypothetical protein
VLASLFIMTKEQRGTVQEVPRLRFDDGYVIADGYLGHGRTAVVYRATLTDGLPVAMKVYHKEYRDAMHNEHDCMVRLQATPAQVLRVMGYEPLKLTLLVMPVAVSLSQLCATFPHVRVLSMHCPLLSSLQWNWDAASRYSGASSQAGTSISS